MGNDDGSIVVAYNGEVYNFRDLRKELERIGYTFRSDCDTEVVLKAYEAWGPACSKRFNGMWAFVICDNRSGLIFGSRDRMGIKPFYYHWDGHHLIVASEAKAILASGLLKPGVDLEGLNEYFTFQNIISERTLFAGIKMLPAGNHMILHMKRSRLTVETYWDMKYEPQDLGEEEFSRRILSTFQAAMDRHLISDVEVGATISGGMDSSAITAITTTYFQNLHTFTGHFDTRDIEINDRCVSERDDARIISQMFGTTHHERLISAQDVIDTLPQIVWHLEDPKVAMCYTFYTIAQQVSQKVKVNLSGSGGDEIYAGYPWRYQIIEDKTNDDEFDDVYYDYWSRVTKDADKTALFTPKVLSQIDIATPRKEYRALIDRAGDVSPLSKALYFEAKTFLHGMLMVEDKMGMAFSVETRVPLLDNEMVAMTLAMPDEMKYRDGISKYMLKKAFEPILPHEIIHKRKQGFTPPDRTWYKRELKGYIRDLLLGRKALIGEYINPDYIARVLDSHYAGADERMTIWSMMFFEGWLQVFLANQTMPRLVLF